ncbi:MAG: RNA-binding protein [Candidatus Poribacteria bacterium]|nr:RNA-binding protein [Candidatus Poribacteria bacterium]
MNIYVGNLSFSATDDDVLEAFQEFGKVETVNVIRDSYDGRSRGFGFVEMPEDAEAKSAIEALDGSEFMGRNLKVNEARPKSRRNQSRDYRGGGSDRW